MDDSLAIWYRGPRYELGRGPGGYAIWSVGGPRSQPLEQWPANPAGWSAAWAKFTAVEAPGSIVHLTPEAAGVVTSPSAGIAGGVGLAGLAGQGYGAGLAGPGAGAGLAGQEYGVGPAGVGGIGPGADAETGAGAGLAGPAGLVGAAGPAGAGATAPMMAAFGTGNAADLGHTPAAGGPFGLGRAFGAGGASGAKASGQLIPVALIAAGVVCSVIGLFPSYYGGTSLAAQSFELVPHLIYLAAWALAAVLILSGGTRRWAGALLGLGTSVVTFGLFIADVGTAVTSGASSAVGAGLMLGMVGWLASTAGAALGLRRGPAGAPRKPGGQESGSIPAAIIATIVALGAAITFAPSWDRYSLSTANGGVQSFTAGNAFSNPGLVITGDLAVMAALVAVVLLAALWRPLRLGAALLAGAAIPMVAQAISAIVQINQPVSPSQLGISPAQAAQAGLTISAGLTPVFWIFCAFVAAMVATAGWMLLPASPPRPSQRYAYGPPVSGSPFGGTPAPGFGWVDDASDSPASGSPGPGGTAEPGDSSAPAAPPSP